MTAQLRRAPAAGTAGFLPLSPWRKRLFPATAALTAEYFSLSRERTVIMGSRIGV